MNKIGVKTNLTVNTGNKSWTVSPTSPLTWFVHKYSSCNRHENLIWRFMLPNLIKVLFQWNWISEIPHFPTTVLRYYHLKCCYPISGCSNEHLNHILVEKPRVQWEVKLIRRVFCSHYKIWGRANGYSSAQVGGKKKFHMIELESLKIKTEFFEKHPQMQKKKKKKGMWTHLPVVESL